MTSPFCFSVSFLGKSTWYVTTRFPNFCVDCARACPLGDRLHEPRGGDPVSLQPHLASVKVREGFVESRERLDEIDAEGHVQIVPTPLEAVSPSRS